MKAVVLGVCAALVIQPRAGVAQDGVDSALIRIERLVVAGDRSSARVLTDSLIGALPPDSPRLADALYWRAQSAMSAADAERDYLRIALEHPFTARAPEALLALAQLEFARGDRNAARRRFDRVLRDYPTGKHLARASLWSGRLAIEDRDYASGCATLNSARSLVASDQVELRNQFDYFLAQCERAPTAADTASTPATTEPASTPGATAVQFTVQVAAYTVRRDATATATRLKERGFDVRVVGDRAPFRVRVGRYPTRAAAMAALSRMRAARVDGMVVEAEPQPTVRR
ncbi:MAG TPA: SPOR domain-containing protein [Thermoanaerobaculia bacterium]|nr:SPOR domain-containing protein [Thermoanaerobaculia bacterium]